MLVACLQTETTRAADGSELRCQLMRIGGVVCQSRVVAFDINNRLFSLPLCRQDLIFKIRHGRSRLLDFGTEYTTYSRCSSTCVKMWSQVRCNYYDTRRRQS